MRYSAYLPISFITASIVLIAPQQARAISSSEVAQIAKGITIKIDRANSNEYGSGFIIKKDKDTYYVLTAYHVVKNPGKYSLTAPDGQEYTIDYKNLKYLKKNLWGERLRDDADKLLQDPQIQPLRKTDTMRNGDGGTPRRGGNIKLPRRNYRDTLRHGG